MQFRKNLPLTLAALVLFAAALLHVAALLAGPSTIAALGGESARQGSLLAPLVIVGIGAALALLGLYSMAAAGRFRSLPGMRIVLGAAAGVFLVRALALPVIWFLPRRCASA